MAMERTSWILSLLLAPGKSNKAGEPIEGTIRLMKELFLLKQKVPEVSYDFVPYDYGPCSFEVYDDIKKLKKDGLIKSMPEPRNEYPVYTLTEKGLPLATDVFKSLGKDTKKSITEIKKAYNAMSMPDLIVYVYDHYRNYATKTVLDLDAMRGIRDINSGN